MERKRSVRRPKRKKTFTRKCRDLCRQFIAFMFSNVGIIGLVVGYTIAGAFIFRQIEGKFSLKIRTDVNRTRTETVWRFWNLTLEMNPFDEHEYRRIIMREMVEYQKNVVRMINYGYDGSDNDYSAKWSFAGAFLYSLTVITTIGYGNISPHTVEGKITTIIYAIIGMPLFLLYLSNIGDIMARSFKWIYANCCLCRWCPGVAKRRAERRHRRRHQRTDIYQPTPQHQHQEVSSGRRTKTDPVVLGVLMENYPDEEEEDEEEEDLYNGDDDDDDVYYDACSEYGEEGDDLETVTVPITICLMIMVGYICGGALLFCKWEDWEFLDASYFCFISLSTIGFGDLVPGDKIYGHGEDFVGEVLELSFIFCSMYLMLGMALIAMCFNLMQEEVIHKIRSSIRTFRHILGCNNNR